MGVVEGLTNIRGKTEDSQDRGPRPKWLRIPPNKSLEIMFLQELDRASEGYNEERGLGFLAIEHVHPDPDQWFRRMLCSLESEGRCLGCERGLKQKKRLYINVLVLDGLGSSDLLDDEGGLPVVRVLGQGYGPQTVAPWLLEYAEDVDSITNQIFKIKRTGAHQNNTSYTLAPKGFVDDDSPDPSEFEVFGADSVVRDVPYEQQAAFFQLGEAAEDDDDDVDTDGDVW